MSTAFCSSVHLKVCFKRGIAYTRYCDDMTFSSNKPLFPVYEKVSVVSDYKRKLRQEIYYALKFGIENSLLYEKRTEFMCGGAPDTERYAQHLIGKINYILQIEPENHWFQKALAQLQANNKNFNK